MKNELSLLGKQIAGLNVNLDDIPSDATPIEVNFNRMGFEVSQLVVSLEHASFNRMHALIAFSEPPSDSTWLENELFV